ncbi:hypothetical protein [Dyella acidiphila]|uniref:Toxin CptA n=1 Tax=Dyella acidiphila TaxID=2775866 RepID=A0ABR9G778_9GAMM|nr:hypothetical protein [Dyella acidiphila]MBE1159903.1 hypothetical protein [Dyella acidiphila]
MTEIRIDMRSYRWVGFGSAAIWLPCAALAATSGQFAPSLGFAIFALLGLYIAFSSGTYVIDEDKIAHNAAIGHWQMAWREVSSAQCSQMGSLVLLGGHKRFLIAPPSWWPRDCRLEGVRFISEQLAAHSIAPTPNLLADYKWMKNTRVKRQA